MSKFTSPHDSPISFSYEAWSPNIDVEVLANENGTGILVIDKLTDDEIELEALCKMDVDNIRARVKAEAKEIERFLKDVHERPTNYGAAYVRGLNEDGKR